MFTGIVEEISTVKSSGPSKLTIKANLVLENTQIGDSIAVNGACLTVTDIDKASFSVDIMPETIRRTVIGQLHYGDAVNLERALPADGRFGGHFVQGHIDGIGRVIDLKAESNAKIVKISAPSEIMRYIVEKGFIAVDGVSLTVTGCDEYSFSVALVDITRKQTILGSIKQGSQVNLEVDIIAKYIERFIKSGDNKVIADFINDYNFSKTG
jgi:riboflavin synthase